MKMVGKNKSSFVGFKIWVDFFEITGRGKLTTSFLIVENFPNSAHPTMTSCLGLGQTIWADKFYSHSKENFFELLIALQLHIICSSIQLGVQVFPYI